ncbi:tetratricopeptide repeat protein [Streptomyces justiciae]|uniref:Tetratricopeptide repeat protein n=1 Tax=Streptomyces justiciae TaxID=2780140 RepID=A0ABU3LY79_9ACTN|nr:tetratricopeptide repeat protein [Streptomyces justiciae]MDT7844202.1 tetratricopeptide repeat protein [Streptomyces justiciae]
MENVYYGVGATGPRIEWPHMVGVLPPEAHCFQPREATAPESSARCRILSGLGGVGKTQLAARWAREAQRTEAVDLLVWVTAATRESVEAAYAQAAHEVDGVDPADLRQAVDHFLGWLQRTRRSWMIVLDDLTDPADLRGLWPPDRPRGQVVVTTRRRDAALLGQGRTVVDVTPFTPDESLAYLHTKLAAHGCVQPDPDVPELAAELGHLPLALAQAAAYIADQGLMCGQYLTRLRDRRRSLTDLVPEHGGLPDDHRETVAAVWELSVERADQMRPRGLARPLLELASVLDSNGIPSCVLTNEAARAYLLAMAVPEIPEDLPDDELLTLVPAESAADALRCLNRLSLISVADEGEEQIVRVHALVQRVVRESLDPEHFAEMAHSVGSCLLLDWPRGTYAQSHPRAQLFRDNADALYAVAKDVVWAVDGYYVFIHSAGTYGHAGMAAKAVTQFKDLYEAAVRHLGVDHPNTIDIQSLMGHWQIPGGNVDGAAVDLISAYQATRDKYGEEHLATIEIAGHLARLMGDTGSPAAAAHTFERLSHLLQVHHPEERGRIAEGRFQAAFWTGMAHPEADHIGVLAERYAELRAEFGAESEIVVSAAHNLASLRAECGDLEGAIDAFEGVLRIEVATRGEDHPETLVTRHNLATYRARAGDIARAVDELAAVLDDRRRILGDEHPATANTLRELRECRDGQVSP